MGKWFKRQRDILWGVVLTEIFAEQHQQQQQLFLKCPRTRQSVFERAAKFDPDTITFRRSRSSSSDGSSDCSNDRSKVEPLESTCDMWWIKSRENNSSSSSINSSINSNNNLSKLNWKCMWKKNKEKKEKKKISKNLLSPTSR